MMLLDKSAADEKILKYLNAKTHWCLIVEEHANFIAEKIETKFYQKHPDHFDAMMYPYKGGIIMMYFADKRDLSADAFYATCRDADLPVPHEAFQERDIVFIADYPYMAAAAEMILELEADQILNAKHID